MIQRRAMESIQAALADTPVVLVQGARQCGKSFLAQMISVQQRGWVSHTFDDITVEMAAAADPAGFVGSMKSPTVLDEVQRVPSLFTAIKAAVDRDRRPGRFLLTGSANVMLLPRISESLAGRMEIVTLWPFSQGEIAGTREDFIDQVFSGTFPTSGSVAWKGPDLLERVVVGGFPEAIARVDAHRRTAWFASYLTAMLQRDVRELAEIDRLGEMPALLSLLASRASGLLNVSDVARGLSLSQSTVRRYLHLLQATFLIVELPAWSSNLGLRLTKAPKVLISDTGLAAHLLGADLGRLAEDGRVRGALVENFVAMELTKQAGWTMLRPRLLHFRTQRGQEVDLVLEDARGRVVGVEVKGSATVTPGDFAGLRALQSAAADAFTAGIVLYSGDQILPFGEKMLAVPIAALWAGALAGGTY